MRARLVRCLLAALLFANAACVVVNRPPPRRASASLPGRGVGPPPHAPAHGYRHKYGGRDLVFDSALGVYAVVDLRDLWFLDGSYFRLGGDHWEIGVGVEGPWRVAVLSAVPVRLREKHHPHGGPPGRQKKHKH